jgi:diguanylate cyclase (GGDEF)-like protein/PAS domain S-box-containing protein
VSPAPGSGRRDELADALTDVAGVIEEDGSVRWVNRAVTARLGWDPSELAGRQAIDFVHPSDRSRARRVFALAAGGRRRTDTQLRLVHADGSFRPASLSLLPRRMGEPDAELVFLAREAVGLQAELEYLAHLAQHDPLTGLANRILLQDRLLQGLARARRAGRPLVVAVVDLDGFKSVNDAHGHPIGDVVLVEVARRLVRSVRPADTVARLGGDEFVVVAEGLTLPEEAASFGARLIGGLQQPIPVPGRDPVSVGASVGIAAGIDQSPNQLVAEADFALLEAKRAGRGRTVLSWERP